MYKDWCTGWSTLATSLHGSHRLSNFSPWRFKFAKINFEVSYETKNSWALYNVYESWLRLLWLLFIWLNVQQLMPRNFTTVTFTLTYTCQRPMHKKKRENTQFFFHWTHSISKHLQVPLIHIPRTHTKTTWHTHTDFREKMYIKLCPTFGSLCIYNIYFLF